MPLLFFSHLRALLGRLGLVLMLSLFASQTTANNQDVTMIKHYDKGYSPLLRVYLTEVLKTVLDKTVPEYGPYKLQFYSRYLSTNRSKLETERGEVLDILFSSTWRGKFVDPSRVIQLEYPVFDGLLGLRSLIVTKEQEALLNNIQSHADFKRLLAGQGSNWIDTEVLEANGVPVIEAQLFDALFPMIAKNRFDYLPLSVLEAQTALQTKGVQFNSLTIHHDLGLFYPLPFYLFVNGQKPELAQRLKRGLQIATEDGSIDRLFRKHFSYIEQLLQESTKKLVIFNSPLLSPEKNQENIDRFLRKYQSYFDIMN